MLTKAQIFSKMVDGQKQNISDSLKGLSCMVKIGASSKSTSVRELVVKLEATPKNTIYVSIRYKKRKCLIPISNARKVT